LEKEMYSTTSSNIVLSSAEKEIGILHFLLKRKCATIHSSPLLYPKSSATAMKNVLQ
jgi:hypothetical protein